MKTLFSAFVVASGLMVISVTSVSARADLESCTPAVGAVLNQAPDHVRCTFSEPVAIAQSSLAVFDASNKQVDNKDTKLDPTDEEGQTLVVSLDAAKLSNGVYSVKWTTVSKEDNNPAQAEWSFRINGPAGAPSSQLTAPSGTPTRTAPDSASNAPAQAPGLAAAVAFRDDPGLAANFGTIVQSMPAHSVQWFRFDYDTAGYQIPRPTVTVRLLNGVSNGLGFEIWSPERLQGGWWQNTPVGRGTQQVLPSCAEPEEDEGGEAGDEGRPPDEGQPPDEGPSPDETQIRGEGVPAQGNGGIASLECGRFITNDLTWTGGFGAGGTYYVRLVNPNDVPIIPQLLIGGPGLTECANANFGLPGYGQVPSSDEAFIRVQCMDVGPGLVATDEPPAISEEEGEDE